MAIDTTKPNPTTNKPWTMSELQAEIVRLETEMNAKNNRVITFKVAEKEGGIMALGVNATFPVTLYHTQWQRLVEAATGKPVAADSPLGLFIVKAEKYLAVKGESPEAAATKHLLRQAESNGIVGHPSKNKKTETA